jgi:hypothetical protein
VHETAREILNYDLTRVDDRQIRLLRKELVGLKIDQTHTKKTRRWKIKGISSKSANEERFTDQDGNEHTVASYFAGKYGKLKFPDIPLIVVRNKQSNVYLPMEHCVIAPKQRLVKVLSDIQMAEAIKHASVQPREHQRITEKYIKVCFLSSRISPHDIPPMIFPP